MVNTVVEKVSALLKDVEDLDVLEQCRTIIHNRYVVVSGSSSSDSHTSDKDQEVSFDRKKKKKKSKRNKVEKVNNNKDSSTSEEDYSKYAIFKPNVNVNGSIIEKVQKELNSLDSKNYPDSDRRVVYHWLASASVPYKFGNRTHKPARLDKYPAIKELMSCLNQKDTSQKPFNSCLVSFYRDGTVSSPIHSDNEDLFDLSSPVGNMSLGPTRLIEFKKSKADITPTLSFELPHQSILYMMPGCQNKLLHQLVQSDMPTGGRFSLSFRVISDEAIKDHSFPDTEGYQSKHSAVKRTDINKSSVTGVIEHVILGDSLTRHVKLPNTLNLCQGGARPNDLANLINDNLDDIDTNLVKTVTISAGTNMVEYDRKLKRFIPMLQVYSDYDHLIRVCIGLFPNAKLLLFNVPPRTYMFEYTHDRICMLNFFIRDLEKTYSPKVKYVPLYDEFLYNGWLNNRLYQPDLLHFSREGVNLVGRALYRARIA